MIQASLNKLDWGNNGDDLKMVFIAGNEPFTQGEIHYKDAASNAKEKGVIVTASGLQYKIIEAGEGKSPTSEDKVVAHYTGKLLDGTVFDSSHDRGEPATFPVSGVIKGWQEALPLMKEGGKWQLVIPAKLAYGERGAGAKIGPNEALMFDIELVAITK